MFFHICLSTCSHNVHIYNMHGVCISTNKERSFIQINQTEISITRYLIWRDGSFHTARQTGHAHLRRIFHFLIWRHMNLQKSDNCRMWVKEIVIDLKVSYDCTLEQSCKQYKYKLIWLRKVLFNTARISNWIVSLDWKASIELTGYVQQKPTFTLAVHIW